MSANIRLLLMILLGCGFVLPVHSAQSRSDVEGARAKFQEAQKSFEAHRYSEAAVLFREAYELSPNWRLLFNMAQSEAAARNFGPALQYFEQYLAMGGDDVPSDRKDEVIEEIRRMRNMVAFVELDAPEGCVVRVNGVDRDITPLAGPLMINAGVENELVVQLGGTVLLRQRVRLSSQQTRRIEVPAEGAAPTEDGDAEPIDEDSTDKEPMAPVDDDTADPTSDSVPTSTAVAPAKASGPLMAAGWVMIGTGLAAGVVGGVTGAMALKTGNELKDDYDGLRIPRSEEDAVNRMNALGMTSTITLIAGGALATAGVVLLLVGRRNRSESLVSLSPVMIPGQALLHIEGRF